ncbi:hypothetical protein MTO96_036071 [Rhipicephalus appendiculatus]|uniref:Secreted protein n=1 Tax=Rhipicephalus appendiculatus TaxID=34631 RepID=A0A131YD66_RHIAP
MQVHHASIIFFLGLFCPTPKLDQGPTCVLAVTRKPATAPVDRFPEHLQKRPPLLRHPALAPIREEPHDPLYKRPGELQQRHRLLKRPSLPSIREEGESPRRWWSVSHLQLRMRLLAGSGYPPITGFAFHQPRHPHGQAHGRVNMPAGAPNIPHVRPNNPGQG